MSNQPQAHVADERAAHYYDPLHLVKQLLANIGWSGAVGSFIKVDDDLRDRLLACIKRTDAARAAILAGADVCLNSAALADAACPTCHGAGQVCVGTSGQESDGNAPVMEPCGECGYFDPIAAGAPAETPKPDVHNLQRFNCSTNYQGMTTRATDGELVRFDDVVALIAAQPAPAPATDAMRDVLAERQRQQDVEGWTPAHDDAYRFGELGVAALCYLRSNRFSGPIDAPIDSWPWPHEWWKPTTRRRNLVKAGALIIAEIERIDRAAMLSANSPREAE